MSINFTNSVSPASSVASAAATFGITNVNAAGGGFNDTTPAAPVGGNPGMSLGQQRLNAFTCAANIWGSTLTSNAEINIQAHFSALTCTATSATLGSAGATNIFRAFTGAPVAGHWYSYALANKLCSRVPMRRVVCTCPFISGSSVSHYDVSAFRNQLMEPNINSDLTQSVKVPQDLTFKLLQDVGW